jgi:hypothetical protein
MEHIILKHTEHQEKEECPFPQCNAEAFSTRRSLLLHLLYDHAQYNLLALATVSGSSVSVLDTVINQHGKESPETTNRVTPPLVQPCIPKLAQIGSFKRPYVTLLKEYNQDMIGQYNTSKNHLEPG